MTLRTKRSKLDIQIQSSTDIDDAPLRMSLPCSENVPGRSIGHGARDKHRKQCYQSREFHNGNNNVGGSGNDSGGMGLRKCVGWVRGTKIRTASSPKDQAASA